MHKRILYLGILLTAIVFSAGIFLPARLHLEYIYQAIILLSIWAFIYAIFLFKKEQDKLRKSDEHLNAMFANATEGMVISNLKGEIVMVNPHAEQMFGYAPGELKHAKIEQLVPQRFSGKHVSHRTHYYGELKTRPMGKGISLYARRKDELEFPVEISLSNFRIKDETFIISFIIDITDRKKQEALIAKANAELEQRVNDRTRQLAEANENLKAEMEERSRMEVALRDSERLYRTMAHNFPNGWIEILDRSLRRIFIDGTELQELGIQREDFLGKSKLEKELLRITAPVREKLEKVFEWQSANMDIEYGDRIYEVSAVPLPDIKGIVKEILLVIQNVTELRKAETEIRESLEKEKQLNELKSRFVSIASHEFRTPLSTILSSVSLAQKYSAASDEEKRTRHFERIKSSVKNLTEILNDFLSLEKLEAGKIECRPAEFDIVNFAEDLKEQMQSVAKTGQQILYTHSGATSQVHLDKQLLQNICINLINNAIKYSAEHAPIEFTTDINSEIKISVKDHGLGIPKADQPHLFERFFRAQNVTAIQGTGLGLNIVNRYVKLMNGKIEFSSEENAGSEFTVKFINQ